MFFFISLFSFHFRLLFLLSALVRWGKGKWLHVRNVFRMNNTKLSYKSYDGIKLTEKRMPETFQNYMISKSMLCIETPNISHYYLYNAVILSGGFSVGKPISPRPVWFIILTWDHLMRTSRPHLAFEWCGCGKKRFCVHNVWFLHFRLHLQHQENFRTHFSSSKLNFSLWRAISYIFVLSVDWKSSPEHSNETTSEENT